MVLLALSFHPTSVLTPSLTAALFRSDSRVLTRTLLLGRLTVFGFGIIEELGFLRWWIEEAVTAISSPHWI